MNIQYPTKVILDEIQGMIENEQRKFYDKNPKIKQRFIKKDRLGRDDTYQFDEWERYLKVYMLKEQKMSPKDIRKKIKIYECSDDITAGVQISRDYKKAKNLSRNAVAQNFPGDYQ